MKILFQGDSITDAGASAAQKKGSSLGSGYPKYAAEYLREMFSDKELDFINLGISGNQTKDIVERIQTDIIDVKPDLTSILVGINDVWHHFGDKQWIPNDVFEERYRIILEAIKSTGSHIVMMEPYFIPVDDDEERFRVDLPNKVSVIRKLAREYAEVYIPLDGYIAAECVRREPKELSEDGVHPSPEGARFIGRIYAVAVSPIIEKHFANGGK